MDYENYDPSFPDQPVVDQYLPIWAKLPAFSSKQAFIWVEDDLTKDSASTLTYEQLNNSVQSISSKLLVPLQRGDTVVILCSPGLELVEIIFGCQRAGLLSVLVFPPDPSFVNENLHHLVRVLSQTKPKAAIAHHGYISNSELYLIQYTSGATGIPTPVLVTASAAAHNVRTARKAYDLNPNSVVASYLLQYHGSGLLFLLLAIVSSATCVLTSPSSFTIHPRLWLELITKFMFTCTPVPSFTLPLVVKRGGVEKGEYPVNLWSLRNLIIINEPIYKAAVEEFVNVFKHFGLNPSSISPSYGLAENCTFVSTAWRNDNNSANSAGFPSHNKLLPSARLASRYEEEGIHIMVVNEITNEPIVDGVEGEIWVSSPSNASVYLGHPLLTLDALERRLKNNLSQCFVRTGDRGIIKGEERCPETLRGVCLAAFMASRIIVLVAKMQTSGEVDKRVLRNICEGIKRAVLDEEKVELGLVVLKWLLSSVGAVNNHESKGKVGGRGRGGEEQRNGKAEGTEEAVFSFLSYPTRRPSLLSPL
ncbi:hypothetical protein SLA2020_142620 [Shorea laevis]